MVIGNTLYGAASSYQSMEMCLIGRAISGLGAPRIINRRYVADSTPFKLRTMSSAAFALTTALGAASGPGVAILLDMIPEFQFTLPILGVQTFNGMTGPGFVMAVLWFLFAIAILISFKEPNRSGLDELKQREALAKANEAGQKALKEPLQPDGLQNEGVHGVPTGDYYDDDASIGSLSVDSSYRREEHEYSKHSPLYCIKNMTRATALCMGLIFMKRIALEVSHDRATPEFIYFIFFVVLCLRSTHFGSSNPLCTEHRWIHVRHHQKPICMVHQKCWNPSFGEWYHCHPRFHLRWLAVTIP